MNRPVEPKTPRLSLEALARIDEVCTRFEQGQQQGKPSSIEGLLQGFEGPDRQQLLLELLLLDLNRRPPDDLGDIETEYRQRFRSDHAVIRKAVNAHRERYERQHSSEHTVTLAESPSGPAEEDVLPETDGDEPARVRYFGEYEIHEEIARGGMGVVFKARQRTLKRTIALKLILTGRLADDGEIARFKREAQAASRLSHPNIVSIHEIGEHKGRHYFTMDFIDGPSLADMLREETLAPADAATLVRTIAEAVHYAHGEGTVHRDLKPANILLTTDGTPHVTDFGLAKVFDDRDEESWQKLTNTGQVVGTPSYMSPEQAAGKGDLVGPASDIWSLGAILYACLTGRPPFLAETQIDTLMQVMRREPVSPRELNPAVPKDLETICLKCLNKEPHERYGTARKLADDLKRFVERRPVLARPVGRTAKLWRWAKRNPVVASLATLSVLLLVSGTVVSAYFAIEAHDRAESEKDARGYAEQQKGITQQALKDAESALALSEQSERASEHSLYFARIHLARNHWERGLVARTKELLKATQHTSQGEDIRNWEWYWIHSLCRQDVATLQGHRGRVVAVDCNPTKQLIASGGEDGTVRIWTFRTRKQSHVFAHHHGAVLDVGWNPVGTQLCSVGADGAVCLWALDQKEPLDLKQLPSSAINTLCWSPNGELLATGGAGNNIYIWRIRNEALEPYKELGKLTTPVRSIDWSADGTKLFVGHGADHNGPKQDVTVWSTENWKKTNRSGYDLSLDYPVRSLSTSADGQVLAITAAHGRIRLFNTRTMRESTTFSDVGEVCRVCWNSQRTGPLLAFGGHSQTVRVFDPQSNSTNAILWGHHGLVSDLSWLSDSILVSAGADGTIRCWDVSDNDEASFTRRVDNYVSDLSWSPDGQRVAIAHLKFDAILWDTTGRRPDVILRGHRGRIWSIDWHPGGDWIATTGVDMTTRIWNANTGQQVWISGKQPRRGENLEWSPSGNQLAVKCGQVQVWQFDPGQGCCTKQLARWDRKSAWGLSDISWHPNGEELALVRESDGGNFVEVWNWRTDETLASIPSSARSTRAVAWSPGGERLAFGSNDGVLQMWEMGDRAEKKLLFSIQAHDDAIGAIRWTHDGKRIATSGWEGSVKIRSAQNGEEMLEFRDALGRMEALEWGPKGKQLATGNWADNKNVVRIYDASRAYEEELDFNVLVQIHGKGDELVADGLDAHSQLNERHQATELKHNKTGRAVTLSSTYHFDVVETKVNGLGLTTDGKRLWVSAQGLNDVLLEYSLSGTLLQRIPARGGNIGGGMAHDGTSVYVLTYWNWPGGNKIYRLARDRLVEVYRAPDDHINAAGLTFHKGSFVYGHGQNAIVNSTLHILDSKFKLLKSTPVPFHLRGLASDGESLWCSGKHRIFRLNNDFTVGETFDAPFELADLTFHDGSLWAIENNENRVHRFLIESPKNAGSTNGKQ